METRFKDNPSSQRFSQFVNRDCEIGDFPARFDIHYVAMKEKRFLLSSEAIRPDLAPGRGSCFATDLITVEGKRVGLMYREDPDNDVDSGWRFFAGTESQDYVDDPENLALYDVNTIANYDRDIIPLLDAPVGSAFERHPKSGIFVPFTSPASN